MGSSLILFNCYPESYPENKKTSYRLASVFISL
jgi:hypothetical protein